MYVEEHGDGEIRARRIQVSNKYVHEVNSLVEQQHRSGRKAEKLVMSDMVYQMLRRGLIELNPEFMPRPGEDIKYYAGMLIVVLDVPGEILLVG